MLCDDLWDRDMSDLLPAWSVEDQTWEVGQNVYRLLNRSFVVKHGWDQRSWCSILTDLEDEPGLSTSTSQWIMGSDWVTPNRCLSLREWRLSTGESEEDRARSTIHYQMRQRSWEKAYHTQQQIKRKYSREEKCSYSKKDGAQDELVKLIRCRFSSIA